MLIKKVLNSSVVLVEDDAHQESILLGKGIGYGQKQGNVMPSVRKTRCFCLLTTPVPGKLSSWSTACP